MKRFIVATLAGCSAFAMGTGVHAQTSAPPADAARRPAEPSTPDIIVTARRTEERLQDVPISITVYNQQQLANRNVVTAGDLATYTPSLASNSNFGTQNTTFALRGFVQDQGTAPSVGVYFADVVAPRGAASNYPVGDGANPGDFFDLQNVQVLKGPQGTLFGRNTTGGAVLLVPQKPTSRLEGYVEGSIGNYDMKRIQGVINIPLMESARLRLGVDHMDRGGYIRNTTGIGPSDFADLHYTAARASLVVDLTPNLENYLIGSYIRSEDHGTLQKLVACDSSTLRSGAFNLLGLGLACPALARNTAAGYGYYSAQNLLPDPFTRTTSWRFINTTTWHAGDTLTIKNVVSYAQFRQVNNSMLFGTVLNTADLSPYLGGSVPANQIPFSIASSIPGGATTDQSTFTEELQFQGSLFDDRVSWQAGGYLESSAPLNPGGSQSPVYLSCTNAALRQCTDVTAPYIPGPGGLGQLSYSPTKTNFHDVGIYAQSTVKLTDKLKLTGGIRYTWDRQFTRGQIAAFLFDTPNVPTRFCTIPSSTANDCNLAYRQKSSAPTWLVDLDYDIVDNVMVYAKYARGYRAGGIAIQAPPSVAVFKPEKVEAYEAGIKTSFRGAISGTFNVAGFYNDFEDQQLQLNLTALPPNRGTATGTFNAGRSRIYGAEVDMSVTPFRGFTVDGGYSYINATIRQIALPTLDPSGGYTIEAQSVHAGDPLTLTPKHKLSATATYTLPLDESIGRISIGGTFTYIGRQLVNYADRFFLPAAIGTYSYVPSRSLVNANVNWRSMFGLPLDGSFFMTNLTNRKYYSYAPGLARAVPYETAILGEPRMFGFPLRYNLK